MIYKLAVYVPQNFLEKVKSALFLAGAGTQGNYQECCWQVLGTGEFKPIEGSVPYIGEKDRLEKVAEWRLEILVDESKASDVKAALLESHPYEEPAFEFLVCADIT